MVWGLVIAAGLALLFTLALAVPVELAFRIRTPGAGSAARLEWLFGLVGTELRPKRTRERERREERAAGRKGHAARGRAKRGRRGRLAGLRKLRALLGTRGFLRRSLQALRQLLARVELRDLEGALRFGLEDPADTGLLYAACLPAVVSAALVGSRVRLEPVFDGPAFQLRAAGRVRFVPLRLVPPVVAFACSRTTLRALRSARRA